MRMRMGMTMTTATKIRMMTTKMMATGKVARVKTTKVTAARAKMNTMIAVKVAATAASPARATKVPARARPVRVPARTRVNAKVRTPRTTVEMMATVTSIADPKLWRGESDVQDDLRLRIKHRSGCDWETLTLYYFMSPG
jgi:hypothetical protein